MSRKATSAILRQYRCGIRKLKDGETTDALLAFLTTELDEWDTCLTAERAWALVCRRSCRTCSGNRARAKGNRALFDALGGEGRTGWT